MPTIHITLSPESLADLDAICKRSGYSRSEQIAGMIEAAKEEEQEIQRRKHTETQDEITRTEHTCPTCGRQTDDITQECWDCMEKHSE